MKKQNKQNGITLVALVITIIVLLILAGISISALTNTGIFGKAQQAKQKTENAQKEESEILENYLAQMNAISFKNIDKTKTNPEAAMPKGAVVIEGDANKGIVIKDNKDNEWVWVEVPKTTVFTPEIEAELKTATETEKYEKIKDALIEYAGDYREGKAGQNLNWTDEWYAMDGETLVTASTSGLTDSQKALSNGCGLTYNQYQEIYQKMLSSVYTNGGFWISRYEAGIKGSDTDASLARPSHPEDKITDETISTFPEAVSQSNMIPYNNVYFSEAQTLAKKMSTDATKTSSLLFGIQWDLTCKFLQEKGKLSAEQIKGGDGIGSTNWGNYKNATVTPIKTGTKQRISGTWTASTADKIVNSSILLTTGASDYTKKMNIYDFTGNVWEWTLEYATSNTSIPCAVRGGGYGGNGSVYPASYRGSGLTTSSDNDLGFRSTLY